MSTFIISIIAIFWPIGLILHNQNQPAELFTYIAPAVLIYFAYRYYECNKAYSYIAILLIALVAPKLSLFPIIFLFLESVVSRHLKQKRRRTLPVGMQGSKKRARFFAFTQNDKRLALLFLAASLIVGVIQWKSFYGQTIFVPDYEAQQKVIRDQRLYPTPFTARLFHNKARIVLDKFGDNFFSLIDPNNYFFGFAPRQIVGNQNLQKFPFMSLPFFLYGLFFLFRQKQKSRNHKGLTLAQKRFIFLSLITSIFSLSFLTIFDRNDFVLFFPLFLIILFGIQNINSKKNKYSKCFYAIFVIFSTIEFIRLFLG